MKRQHINKAHVANRNAKRLRQRTRKKGVLARLRAAGKSVIRMFTAPFQGPDYSRRRDYQTHVDFDVKKNRERKIAAGTYYR